MSYAEFQEHFEKAAGEEKARYDAVPVSILLAEIRARRFGEYYQIWHSVAERATAAEAANDLLHVLESDADYLNRYHCASALISVAGLGAAGWTAEKLSVAARFPIHQNLREIRELLALQPMRTRATPAVVKPAASAVHSPRQRSVFITILAWVVIVMSVLALLISFVSALMAVAHSYGTSTGGALDWLLIVGGPPAFLLVGIGLLRRKRWAYLFMLVALFAVLVMNIYGIIKGPSPQSSYVSAAGVPTTVLASEAQYSLPIIAVCICLLVLLLSLKIRSEFWISQGVNLPSEPPL